MTNVSRRSIAKGAAWSVPAVVISSPAAFAATSYPTVDCTTVPSVKITGVKSFTGTSGLQASYDQNAADSDAKIGTQAQINLGMWAFAAPAGYVTGYRLKFGSYLGVTTVSGVPSRGTAPGGGVETAQVIGAGLAQNLFSQTGVPYRLLPKAVNAVQGISVPFCVTWLAGLNPTTAGTEVGQCCYFMNFDLNNNPGPLGNYTNTPGVANGGDAYSITTTAKYGS